jgi:hypothetical protein
VGFWAKTNGFVVHGLEMEEEDGQLTSAGFSSAVRGTLMALRAFTTPSETGFVYALPLSHQHARVRSRHHLPEFGTAA